MSEEHLTRIERAIAELRAEMATELAGVARNVDFEALARLARQLLTETAAVHDELRVVSAFAQLSRLVEQQERAADRLRALEEQHP